MFQQILGLFAASKGTVGGDSSGDRYNLPQFWAQSSVASESRSGDLTPSIKKIIDLNLCISRTRLITKFSPLDLVNVKSNRALFTEMRCARESFHGKIYNMLSLRTLSAIKFVCFVLHKRLTVDIKECSGPLSLPPPDKLNIYKYTYEPAPPDYLPPIGENLLMHLYKHPGCADDECADLLPLFPKKIVERLEVDSKKGMSERLGHSACRRLELGVYLGLRLCFLLHGWPTIRDLMVGPGTRRARGIELGSIHHWLHDGDYGYGAADHAVQKLISGLEQVNGSMSQPRNGLARSTTI